MYKQFDNYEVFTAADANTLMRQGIITVTGAAERDTILAPTDGMSVYRQDLDAVQRYRSGAWRTIDDKQLTQSGIATIVGSGAAVAEAAITFDTPFSSAPVIVSGGEHAGSTSNAALMVSRALNITPTGFTLRLKSSVNFAATYDIPWIAVGRLA